jgi:transcriptional regulator GlxA family with amidase domain
VLPGILNKQPGLAANTVPVKQVSGGGNKNTARRREGIAMRNHFGWRRYERDKWQQQSNGWRWLRRKKKRDKALKAAETGLWVVMTRE